MTKCLYPVRVPTGAPWDDAFPGELPCGEPSTHTWELAFYLDGYNRPGLTHHRTKLFSLDVCDKHAAMMPSLRLTGPNAADLVAPGVWKQPSANT